MSSLDVRGIRREPPGARLDEFMERISPHFARAEPRSTARDYIEALLGTSGRRTFAQIAGYCGASRPDSVRRLLGSARWDCDLVRDELVAAIACRLAHASGILTIRPRCFPKKGDSSVGVERHFCPRSERLENSQVGVLGVFDVDGEQRLVDRELYLPPSWTENDVRRERTRIPGGVHYEPVTRLAGRIAERCITGPLDVAWIVGGPVVSEDGWLRRCVEHHGDVHYVLELTPLHLDKMMDPLWIPGPRQAPGSVAVRCRGDYALAVTDRQRSTSWWRTPLPGSPRHRTKRWLLVNDVPGARRGFVCAAPADSGLDELVRVARSIERTDRYLDEACARVGLDTYECRHWRSWYRHVTLSSSALHCIDG